MYALGFLMKDAVRILHPCDIYSPDQPDRAVVLLPDYILLLWFQHYPESINFYRT